MLIIKLRYYPLSLLGILFVFMFADAQELQPGLVDVSHPVIQKSAAKETEFRLALNEFSCTRDAIIQTIGSAGQVTGEYHRTSDFVFDDKGTRFEKITFFPPSTLTAVNITNEDIEDLGGIQPFALEASKISLYKFIYIGKEKIDEIDTYVFDVSPKVMPKKVSERFFQGRIWIDNQDLQIVKVRGKGVPEGDQRFPIFETYREQIDDRLGHFYWFPTYTYADDELVFKNGNVVRLRMIIRFSNYKRFVGRIKLVDDEPDATPPPGPPVPKPKKP